MAPKTSTQKPLSFRAQSKPKSSYSASARDQLKAKPGLKSTTRAPIKSTSPPLTKQVVSKAVKDEEHAAREELDVDDPRWDGVWRKAKKSMNVPPSKAVHIDHEDRIQKVLRVFDLDPNYGPCIGLSRLERWHRAKDLDLNPPQEIHDILTTKQGASIHKENVFSTHTF